MVDRHVSNQETLIEAGFVGVLSLAFQAFLNDALVMLPREEASELFRRLVDIEEECSEDYDFEATPSCRSSRLRDRTDFLTCSVDAVPLDGVRVDRHAESRFVGNRKSATHRVERILENLFPEWVLAAVAL